MTSMTMFTQIQNSSNFVRIRPNRGYMYYDIKLDGYTNISFGF